MYNYSLWLCTVLLFCSVVGNFAQQSGGNANDPNANNQNANNQNAANTFDFIVVGLGGAGSVIASRLIESTKGYTVLGIEAGNRTHRSLNGTDYVTSSFSQDASGNIVLNTPFTRFDVPTFFGSTYIAPTPYQDFPIVRNGVLQSSYVARVLGGSAAHNGMVWSRSTKPVIDAMNVTGWKWEDVLPYYIKSENASNTRGTQNPSYHGFSGPIGLTDVPANSLYYEVVNPLIAACVATGLPYNPDFNGPNRLGCGTQQYNIKNGIRSSSANEYLPKAAASGRLTLALNSFANKVIIDRCNDGTLRAVGVEFVQNGTVKQAYARKDVIISLSAIMTPKILQLSGIGPASLLRRYGIPVLVNNPYVGGNLSNQQYITGSWAYPNATLPNGWRIGEITQEYALNQTGVLAFPGQFATVYACSGNCPLGPDVTIGTSCGLFLTDTTVHAVSYDVTMPIPKSRGTVYIASANPADPPIVDMPTYQNEADLNATIYGFQLARRIRNTYPASAVLGPELVPGPTVNTYAEYRNFVLTYGYANAHYSGTARLQNFGTNTGVVDPHMAVVGVKGLRIGDTSVIHQSNSHTQATAIMCGERAAAFSLADADQGSNCQC